MRLGAGSLVVEDSLPGCGLGCMRNEAKADFNNRLEKSKFENNEAKA